MDFLDQLIEKPSLSKASMLLDLEHSAIQNEGTSDFESPVAPRASIMGQPVHRPSVKVNELLHEKEMDEVIERELAKK